MHSVTLAGFGLSIAVFILGCAPADNDSTAVTSSGAGGANSAGSTSGAGGNDVSPYLDPAWVKILPDIDCVDIVVDDDNQFVILGYAGGSGSTLEGFALVPGRMFIAKFDATGHAVWVRSFSADWREARTVTIGPDHRVVLLSNTTPIISLAPPPWPQFQKFYVTALAANGEFLWEQSLGGDLEKGIQLAIWGADLAIDQAGNAIVGAGIAGRLDTPLGTIETPPDDLDAIFMKIAPDGSFIQTQHFNAPDSQYITSIAIDAANQIVAAGHIGSSEAFIKLDSSFAPVWTKGFEGNWKVEAIQVANGANGDVLAVGTFGGPTDFGSGPVQAQTSRSPFFVHLDSAGNHKSDKSFPQTQIDTNSTFPAKIVANASGDFAVSVGFFPTIDLGGGPISIDGMTEDTALARYSADGVYRSGTRIGGRGHQMLHAVALAPQGPTYWAVGYWGEVKYGDKLLVEQPSDKPLEFDHPRGTALVVLPQ